MKRTTEDRRRGVCYFNHGAKCAARLVWSLWSLRKHYGGPVAVLDTGESGGIAEHIAADERLDVELIRIPFKVRRRNSCYVAKAGLWRHSPYQTTILLDSDTLVARDPSILLDLAESPVSGGVVLTRFSNWVTTGPIICGRLERWRGVVCGADAHKGLRSIVADELVDESLRCDWPAINTGVTCWDTDSRAFLRDWERLTEAGAGCPFTDELAAQLLARLHRHELMGDSHNASPLYHATTPDLVAIWHAHGAKHMLRPDGRGERGHAIWWQTVVECWRADAGRIRLWGPAGDEAYAHNLPALSGVASPA